jgi:hypothetical protein
VEEPANDRANCRPRCGGPAISSRSAQQKEVSGRERYPFACFCLRYALYDLQNSALAECEGKQQLPSSPICSTELLANNLGRECEGAVSPAQSIRREMHHRFGR